MKPKKNVLIIDLDNTIFDWVDMWAEMFTPIYNAIKEKTKASEADIQSQIRIIHQEKRTSEYTFLIDELPLVKELCKNVGIRNVFKDALAESKQARDRALKLYPSVLSTLWDLKNKGTLIVAYTESLSFYSGYRLKKFGLDGVIDFVYCPQDNDLPVGISIEKIRSSPDDFYELQITKIRHTPKGEIKPNRKILLDIIKDLGANAENIVYVGDSLFKDVAMAQQSGVSDVLAEYGAAQQKKSYGLLRKVSHWTDADIERERNLSQETITPTHIAKTFSDIKEMFDFISFKPKRLEDESLKSVIEIWKKCVDVQQHFNDIEMRIRNFAITVTGALVAAVGFTYQQKLLINILSFEIPLGAGIVLISMMSWLGFYLMDRYWYHNLLKGSVIHTGYIEEKYKDILPELGLGLSISKASPVKFFNKSIGSNQKITIFYAIGMIGLILLFIGLVISKPNPIQDRNPNSAAKIDTERSAPAK